MRRIRRGSREAFLELMEAWQGPLARFFATMGAARDEIDDHVQETFVRIFGYRERYRSRGGWFRAFLFRLARNVLADEFRRRRRSCEPVIESDLDRLAVPDDNWAQGDVLDVRWALRRLPARLLVVVALNVYEGLNYREIAEALEIPVGPVKSRMFYAMNQLREALHVESRA